MKLPNDIILDEWKVIERVIKMRKQKMSQFTKNYKYKNKLLE